MDMRIKSNVLTIGPVSLALPIGAHHDYVVRQMLGVADSIEGIEDDRIEVVPRPLPFDGLKGVTVNQNTIVFEYRRSHDVISITLPDSNDEQLISQSIRDQILSGTNLYELLCEYDVTDINICTAVKLLLKTKTRESKEAAIQYIQDSIDNSVNST